MKKRIKYPFTAIMIIVLIIGMPIAIRYLYQESHKTPSHSSPIAENTVTPTPMATAAPTSIPTPTVSVSATQPPTPTDEPSPSPSVEAPTATPTPTPPPQKPSKTYNFVTVSNEYFDDALFIGDSRTVGISEYAPFAGATYFANVGMSAHNIMSTKVSVPSLGKVTLSQLLSSRSYGKVYIMLGINELGYKFSSIIAKYTALLDMVKKTQPNAIIYIEANLHVTKSKSDGDSIINNAAIDKLNYSLSELADGKTTFYIDANELFDDGHGNLDNSYTSDNAHILGKYYAQWGQWFCTKAIQK